MVRRLLAAPAVTLALAAAGTVGYRVFAPTETITAARQEYPAARIATSGVSGELPRAPLIVDGRLRIYAAKRQVWADAPVAARTETTPYWSYRRWPAELVGVVVTGAHAVSRWSDGELVAIGIRTGVPAWRTRSPVGANGYTGGRTGAATVYTPPGLYTGRSYDDREVVVSAGEHTVMGFDAASGTPLWSTDASSGCHTDGFTGPGFYADVDGCAGGRPTLRRYDLADGRSLPDWRPPQSGAGWDIVPLGCGVGRSGCAGARTRDGGRPDRGSGWLFAPAGPDITDTPALASRAAWLAGDLAVAGPAADPQAGVPADATAVRELTARSLPDGPARWTWRAPDGSADTSRVRVVAADPTAVYLISERRTLIVVDQASGLELARTPLERLGAQPQEWTAGFVHVHDRYVAVERLRLPAGTGAARAYLGLRPVLVAGC